MKTAQKIVHNSIKENRLSLKVSSLRYHRQYLGITHLCENAHFIYKILQYTCFNCICYFCSYDKCVWDMSQYNNLHFETVLVSWYPHQDVFSRQNHTMNNSHRSVNMWQLYQFFIPYLFSHISLYKLSSML